MMLHRPAFGASGMTECIGVEPLCTGQTWGLGTCSVVREVGAEHTALRLQENPSLHFTQENTYGADPYVRATLWVQGCVNKGDLLQHLADSCRVPLCDVSFSTPAMVAAPVSAEGALAMYVCLKRPYLPGLNALNHHSSTANTLGAKVFAIANTCRIAIGDVTASQQPLQYHMNHDGSFTKVPGATPTTPLTEGTVLFYNAQCPGGKDGLDAALTRRAELTRQFGFFNYHAVDPLLAVAAEEGVGVRQRLHCLFLYGCLHSRHLEGVFQVLEKDGVDFDEVVALTTADIPRHAASVERNVLNCLLALLNGLPGETALQRCGIDLNRIRAMRQFNTSLSIRVQKSLSALPGDLLLPHGASTPFTAKPSDADEFTLADVVMKDALFAAPRRLVAVPLSVEHHVVPAGVKLGSDVDKEVGDVYGVVKASGIGEGSIIHPAVVLRMVLPERADLLSASMGMFKPAINPQDDTSSAILQLNNLRG